MTRRTKRAVNSDREKKESHLFFLCLLLALGLAWFIQYKYAVEVWQTGYMRDSDDAVRLVEVRDFLNGQGWFDLTQYRMNPPDGIFLHWSRLVDVPVAALIRFFQIFTDTHTAEKLMLMTWPALLQITFFTLSLLLVRELAGRAALLPAAIILGFHLTLMAEFDPYRIDHHSVQMILSLALALFSILAFRNPRAAYAAGFIGALMLAIGFEIIPVLAIVSAFYALVWLIEGESQFQALRNYATALAASHVLIFVATVAPSRYAIPGCDAQSYISIMLALLGCAGIWIVSVFREKLTTWQRRGGALAALGLLVVGAAFFFVKDCLTGGLYANIPQNVRNFWLDQVVEAWGLPVFLQKEPGRAYAILGLLTMPALCSVAAFLLNRKDWMRWGLICTLTVLYYLLCYNQIRAGLYTCTFAAPVCAFCIAWLWRKSKTAAVALCLFVLPPTWLFLNMTAMNARAIPEHSAEFASKLFSTASPLSPYTKPPGSECKLPATYKEFAKLKPGSTVSTVDDGPFILAHTPHSVYAASYHRNIEGLNFTAQTLIAAPEDALRMLRERHVTYLAFCYASDLWNARNKDPASFAAAILSPTPVKGLTKILSQPLVVWRVD